ncbi:MAG: pentapeptide repeat-containing protein [Bacteroidetes bacterium]|nr:pentapeptide repeat-containing protein [Bacteroidota bacterium]
MSKIFIVTILVFTMITCGTKGTHNRMKSFIDIDKNIQSYSKYKNTYHTNYGNNNLFKNLSSFKFCIASILFLFPKLTNCVNIEIGSDENNNNLNFKEPDILKNNILCPDIPVNDTMLNHSIGLLKKGVEFDLEHEHNIYDALKRYVILDASKRIEGDGKDLHEQVLSFIDNYSSSYLVLLASSGSGKSSYGRFLENFLWEKYKYKQDFIPIFISLPAFHKMNINKALIDNFLLMRKLNRKEICQIKNQKLLIIFDSLDEINKKINLYEQEEIDKLKKAKIIVSSRIGPMDNPMSDYIFRTTRNIPAKKLYILPLSGDKIIEYVKAYLIQDNKDISNTDVNKKILKLKNMSKRLKMDNIEYNPLQLKIFLDILGNQKNNLYFDIKNFVGEWFTRESYRILLDRIDESEDDVAVIRDKLTKKFENFSEKLAFQMFLDGVNGYRKYIKFGELNPASIKFFGEDTQIDREGCPIKYDNNGRYTFIRNSIRDYFIADVLFNELITLKIFDDKNIKLNKKLLNKEEGVLEIISDAITAYEDRIGIYTGKLLDIVSKAKESDEMSIAAINSISILNMYNKTIFKNTDCLQGGYLSVEIDKQTGKRLGPILKGADLSGADLSFADLRGVDFKKVNMENANTFWINMDKQQEEEDICIIL